MFVGIEMLLLLLLLLVDKYGFISGDNVGEFVGHGVVGVIGHSHVSLQVDSLQQSPV